MRWRCGGPFSTYLERHSRIGVLLTEISRGVSRIGDEARRCPGWLSVCDGLGGKDDGHGFAYARGSQKKRLLSEVAAIGCRRCGQAVIGE
jgi:hypothetical protein